MSSAKDRRVEVSKRAVVKGVSGARELGLGKRSVRLHLHEGRSFGLLEDGALWAWVWAARVREKKSG